MFAETVLRIEGDGIESREVERLHCLDELRNSIEMRKNDEFLSPASSAEKTLLISSGASDSKIISQYCNGFYGTCVMFIIFSIPLL